MDRLKKMLLRLVAAGALYAACFAVPESFTYRILFFLAPYILCGCDVLLRAGRNILRGHVFDENFLMTLATVGALIIGEYPEAVAVMLFYQVGELFQKYAVGKSRRSIAALMDIRPDFANVIRNGEITRCDPEEVSVGEIISVLPGEKVPLDGVICEGSASFDTSALTGESLPAEAKTGDAAYSGSIDIDGAIKIRVTKEYGESTVSKILEMVENAAEKKAKTESFITRFSRYYTPVVVITALAIAFIVPLASGEALAKWVYTALSFLVVSCPCALVISVPMGFFGGIGGASKRGILIKGGSYLEALSRVKTMVFDKTGTLTKGGFTVSKIAPHGMSEAELLKTAADCESISSHPIARSIISAAGGVTVGAKGSAFSGMGVKTELNGDILLAGKRDFLIGEGIAVSDGESGETAVFVAKNGVYAGYITLADELKEDAAASVAELKLRGAKTVMLTGDKNEIARVIAEKAGIDEARAELMPWQKVEEVEKLIAQKNGVVAFVGDGINDAPVLTRADIGIAMGGLGSDAAIEAADVVLMNDRVGDICTAMDISAKTMRIIRQNIVFALAVKAAVMLLLVLGVANMWEAVFADVGVSVLAILNSMRSVSTDRHCRVMFDKV